MPPPPPAAVRYNDWRAVPVPEPGAFSPARPVSVIVPCYQTPGALTLTLAGLERQDWPGELLQVLVVDDGSDPPLEPPAATPLDLTVVRQARDGFGLARARNTGVRAAAHDILVFLDADVIPEAGLIAAHARWHHAVGDALTLGFCAYVSADGLGAKAVRARSGTVAELVAGRPFDPPWIERHMARTGDFTSRHTDLFRAVTGHNFGVSRALFDEAGGFDESFDRYGGEDTEFAYRAQVRGGLLVPVRDAFGWHQGRWSDDRQHKQRDMDRQAGKLAELIAEPGFRPDRAGRRFAVPRHVVTLDAGHEPVQRVAQAATSLLADPACDLAVCIAVPDGRRWARARLKSRFAQTAGVRIVPRGGVALRNGIAPRRGAAPGTGVLDAFPASPLHMGLSVTTVLAWSPAAVPQRIAFLAGALGQAAEAGAVLDDGAPVSVARAWALNRARRAGGRAADYGDTDTVPVRWLYGEWIPRTRAFRAAGPRRGAFAAIARVWAEARHVRGLRTGWRFLRWLAAAVRWRLRERRPRAPAPSSAGSPTVPAVPTAPTAPTAPAVHNPPAVANLPDAGIGRADPPLGVAIAALGPRSRAVFAASSRVVHAPGPALDVALDVALADTVDEAAAVRRAGAGCALVHLSDAPALAVPAFDPARDNPCAWVRHVEPRALALGPTARLPRGTKARREVTPENRAELSHCHHVEDVAAFHAGPAERAGTLARIAARGTPVRLADHDPALAQFLGGELHGLMGSDVRGADAAGREAHSIAQRRAALRTHTLGARARQLCEAAGAEPPPWPRVSVLLATQRPALLAHAVASVARQRYPRLELVLALHGPGFDPDTVEAALAGFTHPVKVLSVDAGHPLGAVLGAASGEASGALLAKMDDDDVYGPEHLWDLVLARQYTGAALIGKFPATVYLARLDRTVRQRAVPAETFSPSITGGTMLIARADLDRAGGWRALPRHVDEALVEDVLRIGEAVYRTHDTGYVLVRHGHRHTWRKDDARFLATAEAVEDGWRPGLAGLGELAPPRPPDPAERPGANHAA